MESVLQFLHGAARYARHLIDATFGGITVAAVMGVLPSLSAAVSLLYFSIRVWESQTARRLLRAVCTKCEAWWWGNLP